ncbi:MAG: hypothetical protein ACRBB0_20310 [Pelagimonas sp.]|uniref:hypothetical protein n=1 Tax=Pelagimonas sp. TaxID=2073170 RepID=UPI003D6C1502
MTRYAVDKVLWKVAKDPEFGVAYFKDPAASIEGFELDKIEHDALVEQNIRSLFELGAHPFLLYSYAITQNGGWNPQLMQDYVAKLKGLTLGDIET